MGEWFYQNGEPEGLETMFYSDGTIYLQQNFKSGKLNGLTTENYPDGKVHYEVYFKDNVETEKKEYDQNGQLIKAVQDGGGASSGSADTPATSDLTPKQCAM